MSRQIPTGMYRNVDFRIGKRGAADAIQYERSYRLATMEIQRVLKPVARSYKPKTEWFKLMHPKAMPSSYKPQMSPNDYDNWDMLHEQHRLKRERSSRPRP